MEEHAEGGRKSDTLKRRGPLHIQTTRMKPSMLILLLKMKAHLNRPQAQTRVQLTMKLKNVKITRPSAVSDVTSNQQQENESPSPIVQWVKVILPSVTVDPKAKKPVNDKSTKSPVKKGKSKSPSKDKSSTSTRKTRSKTRYGSIETRASLIQTRSKKTKQGKGVEKESGDDNTIKRKLIKKVVDKSIKNKQTTKIPILRVRTTPKPLHQAIQV